jgi:hypothetical protein
MTESAEVVIHMAPCGAPVSAQLHDPGDLLSWVSRRFRTICSAPIAATRLHLPPRSPSCLSRPDSWPSTSRTAQRSSPLAQHLGRVGPVSIVARVCGAHGTPDGRLAERAAVTLRRRSDRTGSLRARRRALPSIPTEHRHPVAGLVRVRPRLPHQCNTHRANREGGAMSSIGLGQASSQHPRSSWKQRSSATPIGASGRERPPLFASSISRR